MPLDITSLNANDQITNSRGTINTNFDNTKTLVDAIESDVSDLQTEVAGLGGGNAFTYLGITPNIIPSTDLTWVNQGGATVDEPENWLILRCPAAGSDNNRMLVRTLTSGFRFRVGCIPSMSGALYSSAGLVIRNSTNGWLIQYCVTQDSISVVRWSGSTAYSSTPFSTPLKLVGQPIFLEITDGLGTRDFSMSFDGRTYLRIFSEPNDDWVGAHGSAADQIGLVANSNNGTTCDVALSVFHFEYTGVPG